ncbi:MAG: hypothetical protein HW388_722 [Dehalococcoidia bacterium]|nr:hypothetical protein [Dehalococcoidia bacterium]
MDWLTFSASVLVSLLSGGLIIGILGWRLELWKFRHQTEREKWQDTWDSYAKQIDSAEKRGDTPEANRVRLEYEGQQEKWRAQQGVEAQAPRSIIAGALRL